METYNLTNLTGLSLAAVTFASNTVTFNALITGRFDVLRDALWHLILPCIAVGTIPLSIIARMTRSSLLEVLGLEYIRTARAKGLVEPDADRFHEALVSALLRLALCGSCFGRLLLLTRRRRRCRRRPGRSSGRDRGRPS